MSTDLFLILLTSSIVITIVLAEVLKGLLNRAGVPYRTHAVVLDSAMIASTFMGVFYRIPFGLGFEPMQLVRLLLLIVFTWFVSMVVYDKLVQTREQYRRYREMKGEKEYVEKLCIQTISGHGSMGESGGSESGQDNGSNSGCDNWNDSNDGRC